MARNKQLIKEESSKEQEVDEKEPGREQDNEE